MHLTNLQSSRHMLYLFSSPFFATVVTVHWDLPRFFPHLCVPDVSFDQRPFCNKDLSPPDTCIIANIYFPSGHCVKPNLGCSQVRKHKTWKRKALRRPREAWCSSKNIILYYKYWSLARMARRIRETIIYSMLIVQTFNIALRKSKLVHN